MTILLQHRVKVAFVQLIALQAWLLLCSVTSQSATPTSALHSATERVDTVTLRTVSVSDDRMGRFLISAMDDVGNGLIMAAKKTELVRMQEIDANTSTNNARQVFATVVGLNVWESDALGLQLGIGGRGLSPDRTSNFTTRQNGYDIAADPLGYPESYYTPPMDAVERIEIVRGGGALRYGTQFGGVINFLLREPCKHTPLAAHASIGSGSYGLFTANAGMSGRTGNVAYSTWYQYRTSEGWRPNSDANQHTANATVFFAITDKLKIRGEYTFMNYLAHQPGGLSDRMFADNPAQSVRARNWFTVNWNIASVQLDAILDTATSLRSTFSGMVSSRTALGNLNRITMADLGEPRTMINGSFVNFTNETTITHDFPLFGNSSSIVTGLRLFRGTTHQQQGNASAGSDADFTFANPDRLEGSDYTFPNMNAAVFAEGMIRLGNGFSVVPGVRAEYISTTANGWYRIGVHDLAGNAIVDSMVWETRQRSRNIILFGIGGSWKSPSGLEVFANAVQNYRAITFTDLRVVNPNIVVDQNIKDESGYTLDIGVRGSVRTTIAFDVSVFYLRYNNKIGEMVRSDQAPLYLPYRYRTNVADAYTTGIESVVDVDLTQVLRGRDVEHEDVSGALSVHGILNASIMTSQYLASKDGMADGKSVEFVPAHVIRAGLRMQWKEWSLTVMNSWVGEQYSDATNATFTASAVSGLIPSYTVLDVSAGYKQQLWNIRGSVNNLLNASYFTRRAVSYPGPGIIPAEPITVTIAASVSFDVLSQ